jgi:protein phosphatase methylesterase 1
LKKEYNVVAFDFRGHGKSTFEDVEDLSADTLVNDTIALLDIMYGSSPTSPAIILVGHSMGGAIATRVAGI